LTLVFDVDDPASAAVCSGKDPGFVDRVFHRDTKRERSTVGLRFPDCPLACAVITAAGCVVVATSANRGGQPPPTDAEGVLQQLGGDVDLLLDAGATRYQGPSTIAHVQGHRLEIVRRGVLDERTVRKLGKNNILLVCTGNTCRSPMAEGLLKTLLAEELGCDSSELEEHGYKITSAGTAAVDGAPPTPEAVQAMKQKGIEISGYQSSALTAEMVRQSQTILVMTEAHNQTVKRMNTDHRASCYLVGGDDSIEDPIGCSSDVYLTCRDQIEAGLRAHLAEVVL
jgi:protein-tyrosine phosphatase